MFVVCGSCYDESPSSVGFLQIFPLKAEQTRQQMFTLSQTLICLPHPPTRQRKTTTQRLRKQNRTRI